jgi:DNA-binding transcriptional MerR regulator/methylmalonyl-CoA mutase cobalamin-binding subunit
VSESTLSPAPRYPVRLVALRTGLSPHVLRAWERRYGVVRPARSEGGQRLYSDVDIERLLRLRRLTARGHAIGRIASLPLPELARMEEQAPAEEEAAESWSGQGVAGEDPAETVAVALQATRNLDALEMQAILERSAITLGVPVFVDQVVAPLLERIGHGWSERSVSVAHEHMASAVVRRVLGWLLRVYEVKSDALRLVVATPPHHAHELGALMAAASAAAEGWNVTYLGPDLPVGDLVNAVAQSGARAVAISAVHEPLTGDLRSAIRETRAGLPEDVTLILGGTAALRMRAEVEAAGAHVVESLAEFRTLLPRLAAKARA